MSIIEQEVWFPQPKSVIYRTNPVLTEEVFQRFLKHYPGVGHLWTFHEGKLCLSIDHKRDILDEFSLSIVERHLCEAEEQAN